MTSLCLSSRFVAVVVFGTVPGHGVHCRHHVRGAPHVLQRLLPHRGAGGRPSRGLQGGRCVATSSDPRVVRPSIPCRSPQFMPARASHPDTASSWLLCCVGATVRVHLWAPTQVKGTLTVSGAWTGNQSVVQQDVVVPAGDSTVPLTLQADADAIKLWWPGGMGSHPLYNVTATFTPLAGNMSTVPIRFTRRTCHLPQQTVDPLLPCSRAVSQPPDP